MEKVLVIRMSSLGDVAMTAPLLASLIRDYPAVQFTMLTREQFQAIFSPIVGLEVIALPIDERYRKVHQFPRLLNELDLGQYDTIIDLHDVLRSKAITVYASLKGKKVFTVDKDRTGRKNIIGRTRALSEPLTPMTEAYRETFMKAGYAVKDIRLEHDIYRKEEVELDREHSGVALLGLAPFTRYPEKSLPLEKIYTLIQQLNRNDIVPFIFGGGDREYHLTEELVSKVKAVNLINRYGLSEDISLIRELDLMISMDSANMHLARLVDTSTISVWGATHPALGFAGWGMGDDDFFQISDGYLACRPCSVFGNVPCKRKDLACLQELDVNLLVAKIMNRLKTSL